MTKPILSFEIEHIFNRGLFGNESVRVALNHQAADFSRLAFGQHLEMRMGGMKVFLFFHPHVEVLAFGEPRDTIRIKRPISTLNLHQMAR
jgi:hypothetical protein